MSRVTVTLPFLNMHFQPMPISTLSLNCMIIMHTYYSNWGSYFKNKCWNKKEDGLLVPLPCKNIHLSHITEILKQWIDSCFCFVLFCFVFFYFSISMPSVSLKVNRNLRWFSVYFRVFPLLPLSTATSAAGAASILAFSLVVSEVVLLLAELQNDPFSFIKISIHLA